MTDTEKQLRGRIEQLEAEKDNLHALLNLSPVVADYPTRLAALHAYRDRVAPALLPPVSDQTNG